MVLKVPKLLDGEDLANEEFPPDKKSMYTYLMEYGLLIINIILYYIIII
jgi:hypothetical protein